MKRVFLILLSALVVILLMLILRPVPTTPDRSQSITATVVAVAERGGPGDIFFKLQDDDHRYYINRATEQGLKPAELKAKLLNQPVRVFYANHWTPLDPGSTMRPITRLEQNGEVLFSYW